MSFSFSEQKSQSDYLFMDGTPYNYPTIIITIFPDDLTDTYTLKLKYQSKSETAQFHFFFIASQHAIFINL